jgi:hypothetical protein
LVGCQQCFSLVSFQHQPPASQQYFSLTTNQHQPPATSQPNKAHLFPETNTAEPLVYLIKKLGINIQSD